MGWIFRSNNGTTERPFTWECYYVVDLMDKKKQTCIRVYNFNPCKEEDNYDTLEECEEAVRLGVVPFGLPKVEEKDGKNDEFQLFSLLSLILVQNISANTH